MKYVFSFFAVVLISLMLVPSVGAATKPEVFGLKLAPLEVRTELKKGQKKKGYVEVSNPSNKTVRVLSSVRAFKQIDNSGTLNFYTDPQIEAGLQVDLDDFELPPWSAARVFYVLDGARLPSGDVFAALFFSTSRETGGDVAIQPSVRVGTLLSIINGTPSSRTAEITKLSLPTFQFGEVKGEYSVKNTGPPSSTGFYPKVSIKLEPFSVSEERMSRLVFPGIERTNTFAVTPKYPGIYRLTVNYQGSEQSQLIMVVTSELIIGLIVLIILFVIALRFMIVRRSQRRPRKYARRYSKGMRGIGRKNKKR